MGYGDDRQPYEEDELDRMRRRNQNRGRRSSSRMDEIVIMRKAEMIEHMIGATMKTHLEVEAVQIVQIIIPGVEIQEEQEDDAGERRREMAS